MQKKDLEEMDRDTRRYFDALPVALREQLMQSSVRMTTREQLESYCVNVLRGGGSGKI